MNNEKLHFVECAESTNNPIWKSFFLNLAQGQCPPHMDLKGDTVSYTIDNVNYTYTITTDTTVPKTYANLALFLQKLDSPEPSKNLPKKKVIRDTLLEHYVLEQKRMFQLSTQVARRFLSVLIIGLMFKTISSRKIEYQNGYIRNIEGFQFEPHRVILTKNIYYSKIRDDTTVDIFVSSQHYLHECWNAYLENL